MSFNDFLIFSYMYIFQSLARKINKDLCICYLFYNFADRFALFGAACKVKINSKYII